MSSVMQEQRRCLDRTINFQLRLRDPNQWDVMLARDTEMWNRIQAGGGLLALASPFRTKLLQTGAWGEPWLREPPGSQKIQVAGSIVLPALGSGDQLVLAYQVPMGYDGVLTGLTQFYTGGGFVEGSGDITWRLRVNQQWQKTLGAMTMSLGNTQAPSPLGPGGIRVYQRNLIRYYVSIAAGAVGLDPLARINCLLFGYVYPQE